MTSVPWSNWTSCVHVVEKSTSCTNKQTGKPLSEYTSEYDAQVGADHAHSKWGKNLVPYKCCNCSMWHLAPPNRITPSRDCKFCCDSCGKTKQLYDTYESARKRASIIFKEKGVNLNSYECPYQPGWHLTKS